MGCFFFFWWGGGGGKKEYMIIGLMGWLVGEWGLVGLL